MANDDLSRVSRETAGRLATLGIALDGREQPDELTAMMDAVERFEQAVESRGGDLMVDEPPEGSRPQPDDPHFALPRRKRLEFHLGVFPALARHFLLREPVEPFAER